MPPLSFSVEVWQETRGRFRLAPDAKQRLQEAVNRIAPVRNEIAHVREVPQDRLLRTIAACSEVLEILRGDTAGAP